ncbi:MAG: hypothetical protein V8T86_11510 [Victivallis sp.]
MSAWPASNGFSPRSTSCARRTSASWSPGMEGALSRWAAWSAALGLAAPTSVGYGAVFGGVAALLGMLDACASGVTVVNIDNGFGAACAAARIIKHSRQVST